MNREHDRLPTLVRSTFAREAAGFSAETVDLWPRIAVAVGGGAAMERRFRPRRWWPVICAAAVLALSTGAGAVVASPALRSLASAVLSVVHLRGRGAEMTKDGVPVALAPVPKFAVYYPAWRPPGLPVSDLGQYTFPGGWGEEMGGVTCPPRNPRCDRPDPSVDPLPRSGAGNLPTVVSPFALSKIDVVWFARSALPPGKRFFQLAEWNAARYPIARYPLARIPTVYAGIREHRFLLVKNGTAIAVDGDLPLPALSRMVRSLYLLEGSRHP